MKLTLTLIAVLFLAGCASGYSGGYRPYQPMGTPESRAIDNQTWHQRQDSWSRQRTQNRQSIQRYLNGY